ncbi:hypothetical protein ACW0KB_19395 [Virgibacillus salarius]
MNKMYIVVDEDGFEIDCIYGEFDATPNAHNLVPSNKDNRLWQPRWDFIKEEWVESLNDEEINYREKLVNKQQNDLSDVELNAIAIMELAKIVLK